MAQDEELPFPSRTARFRQVVERCGRPDVHLSLVAPARDRALQTLQRSNRVMTVWQAHRGTGTDHGVVGLFPVRSVQFLVFGRSLKAFTGKRIVGLDYSLLNHPSGSQVSEERVRLPSRGTAARRQSRASPVEAQSTAASEPIEPASPPGPTELKLRLRRIERLLAAKRYASAHDQVRQLVDEMEA